MQTQTANLTDDERNLLKYIYAKNGNRTKALLQEAWETGIYDNRLAIRSSDEATLQCLRNQYGPSWLAGLSFKQL